MAARKRARQRTTADAYRELSPETRHYIHLYTAPRAPGSRRTQAEYDTLQDAWEKFPPDERADVRELMTRVPWETLQRWYREQAPTSGDRRRSRRGRTRRDSPRTFRFADVHTAEMARWFFEDIGARTQRPVLRGRSYRAHGKKFHGPLLLVLGRPQGSYRDEQTAYYLDEYGNIYFRRGGDRFQLVGNVKDPP